MKSYLLTTLSALTLTSALAAADTPATAPTTTATLPLSVAPSSLTPQQTADIQKLVEQSLQANPKMVLNALQAAMELAKQEEAEKIKQAVVANSDKIFKDPNSPTKGNKTGPVFLTIFLDPNCGACKMFDKEINTYLKDNKDLQVTFKDISIFGEPSAVIARALLASNLQGKYESLQKAVLESKEKLDEKGVVKLAGSLGLDSKKLQADMNSDKIKAQLDSNMQLAQAIGVNATPTWMILGGDVYQGYVPADELVKIIAAAKSGTPSTETTPQSQAKN